VVYKEAERKEFSKKVERGTAVAPGWNPEFAFNPREFDLHGGLAHALSGQEGNCMYDGTLKGKRMRRQFPD
jgi:hypothetical protein